MFEWPTGWPRWPVFGPLDAGEQIRRGAVALARRELERLAIDHRQLPALIGDEPRALQDARDNRHVGRAAPSIIARNSCVTVGRITRVEGMPATFSDRHRRTFWSRVGSFHPQMTDQTATKRRGKRSALFTSKPEVSAPALMVSPQPGLRLA